MTADITDIGWADMTAAGIDTDLVIRVQTGTGGWQYIAVHRDGDTKVAFAPFEPFDGFDVEGWYVVVYDRDGDDWAVISEDHYDTTTAEVLRAVAKAMA